MSANNLPILYANDSCPYVFRARIALIYAGVDVEHREVDLDNKPPAMLQVSPKGTVPVLILPGGAIIDESWEIIRWAMRQDDPENWCGENDAALDQAEELAVKNDSEFGEPSMYYKFSSYYPDRDWMRDRTDCEPFLDGLESRLATQSFMHGNALSVADIPVYPAVAGFATIEPEWFTGRFPKLAAWLERLAASPHVQRVDFDHEPWRFEQTG